MQPYMYMDHPSNACVCVCMGMQYVHGICCCAACTLASKVWNLCVTCKVDPYDRLDFRGNEMDNSSWKSFSLSGHCVYDIITCGKVAAKYIILFKVLPDMVKKGVRHHIDNDFRAC